jgi:hypothetical protein
MVRFITHNGKKFQVGDFVTSGQLNGRIGKIINIDKRGTDNEFNFAEVVPTFGGVSNVRVTALKLAKLGKDLPRLKEHPSFIDNDGTAQLPFSEKQKTIIGEEVKSAMKIQKDLDKKFLGETVKFDSRDFGQSGEKEFSGKVKKVEKRNQGIFASPATFVTVKPEGATRDFFVNIKDLKK